MNEQPTKPLELPALAGRRRLINTWTQRVVALGGGAVILAIVLILFYLLWVVAPIFMPARISAGVALPLPAARTVLLDVNESAELGLRFLSAGQAQFFDLGSGSLVSESSFESPIESAQRLYSDAPQYLITFKDRSSQIVEAEFRVQFEDDVRRLVPALSFPFGDARLSLQLASSAPAQELFIAEDEALSAVVAAGRLRVTRFVRPEPGNTLRAGVALSIEVPAAMNRLLLGPQAQWLYLLSDAGRLQIVSLRDRQRLDVIYDARLLRADQRLTAAAVLLGRYSLLIGDSSGSIAQWFPVQRPEGLELISPRQFRLQQAPLVILPEPRRKGFAMVDQGGLLSLLYSTSARTLASHQLNSVPALAALSPRANLLLLADARGSLSRHQLTNRHPELSWQTLWGKVWYEGYQEPLYSWQSSSADNAFEPKFSLAPLAFGTAKAAFYALLIAIPLALMAAAYSAYFMAPRMRRVVKPGIEIMAALPTVVLGFLAGLWLAPLVEARLAATLLFVPLLVVLVLALASLWRWLPPRLTRPVEGWQALLMVPVLLACLPLAAILGEALEVALFDGNLRSWLSETLDLPYDQRNALIVGVAMGIAVIPTIFAIAEDAIYGVPQHLTTGSLALGATRWQTLTRVVLLTASPGLFSAVMIGLGRAVGETMIVLMATGNTPVTDWNLFQGMRTFAANLAVELPESEVGSTHFRILFLAALVLFLLTFLLNTVAELVRQRLRAHYGNL